MLVEEFFDELAIERIILGPAGSRPARSSWPGSLLYKPVGRKEESFPQLRLRMRRSYSQASAPALGNASVRSLLNNSGLAIRSRTILLPEPALIHKSLS
jgi:hypothetical protein